MTFTATRVRDLPAQTSKRLIHCIEEDLQRQYKLPGIRRAVTSLSNPLSGIDGSIGLRFRIATSGTVRTVYGEHVRIKPFVYYEDTLFFHVGRANMELETMGEPRPFPVTIERRLLSRLYGRAVAEKL